MPNRFIIKPRWLLPIAPENQAFDDQAILIENGIITKILSAQELPADIECIELPQHALMPGLVNAHTHAAMSLLRGLADDLPLMEWLEGHIWPAEATHVNEQFVRDGVKLAIAEMLRGGTTCFNDMYFFPDITAETAVELGMRAQVGLITLDFPTIWAQNADEYISKGLAVHDQYKNHPLITTAFAPHAPYTVSDEPLEKIRTYADELGIGIHIHLHETAFEVQQAADTTSMRPIERLDKLGLLNPSLLAVHMTQLTAEEIALCAERGVHVAHCPESNLKLASGFCPVAELVTANVNVAIGTDGAASNNDLDMLSEIRTAALLAKGVAQDAAAVPAAQALHMATMGGAKALHLDHTIGSIEVGKAADLVAIDLGQIETQPCYDPMAQIAYSAGRNQVTDTWVAGERLLNNRQLTRLQPETLLTTALDWQKKIA